MQICAAVCVHVGIKIVASVRRSGAPLGWDTGMPALLRRLHVLYSFRVEDISITQTYCGRECALLPNYGHGFFQGSFICQSLEANVCSASNHSCVFVSSQRRELTCSY